MLVAHVGTARVRSRRARQYSLLPSPTRRLELFARIEMFYKDALRRMALGFAGLDCGALRGP